MAVAAQRSFFGSFSNQLVHRHCVSGLRLMVCQAVSLRPGAVSAGGERQTTGRGREYSSGASGPQLFRSFDRQRILLTTCELCGMQEKHRDASQGVATAFSGSLQSSGERDTNTEPEVCPRGGIAVWCGRAGLGTLLPGWWLGAGGTL